MMMSGRTASLSAICAALMLIASPALAQPSGPPSGAGASCQPLPAESADKAGPAKESKEALAFADAVKGLDRTDGLFPLYENPKNGDLFMEISNDQLAEDKSFIYHMQILQGATIMGVVPGYYRGPKLLKFSRYFDKIEITQKNTHFYADPENPLSGSVQNAISDALLASTKIVAQDEDGKAEARYLVCANDIFKTEALMPVTPPRKPGDGPLTNGTPYKVGNVDASKSKIYEHRNYPKNTDIRVEYVFSHPDSTRFTLGKKEAALADARNVSMRVSHMLVEAPENDGFVPRRADFRVGYFGPERDDLISLSATPYHDFISRWNLKKKHPEEAVSEPVKPIVWWIGNTTPVEYRDEIERGVLAWNAAFEKFGFRNVMVVRQQPDDADWDAGDLRYNVIYFGSNPRSFFHGYGPSLIDPRTGEILGADIALEYSIMQRGDSYARSFGGENALSDVASYQKDVGARGETAAMARQAQAADAVLAAQGVSEEARQELINQFLTSVVIHEVGHTLGLTHNMKASSSISLDDLKNGGDLTTGSIMDYLPANFTADKGKNRQYYQTKIGPYDEWAIEYGYHPALDDPKAEEERENALLARSTEQALVFGNDAEVVQYNLGVDPRTLINDMSDDLEGWTEIQARNIDEAIQRLTTTHVQGDEPYQDVRNTLQLLLGSRRMLVTSLAMVVGGAHMEVATANQLTAEGKAPFEPVSRKEQERAVDLIIKLFYAPGAYDFLTPDLLKRAQYVRRGFDYGEEGRGEPVSTADIVAKDQAFLFQYLLSSFRLNRLTEMSALGGDYSSFNLLGGLTDAIYGKSCFSKPDQYQRIGQTAYLNKLIAMTTDDGYDANAKAAAQANLSTIRSRISGMCNVAVGDEIAGHRAQLRRVMSMR